MPTNERYLREKAEKQKAGKKVLTIWVDAGVRKSMSLVAKEYEHTVEDVWEDAARLFLKSIKRSPS